MINSITMTGRLTRSAELKFTKNNCAVCTFPLAVNERRYVKEQQEDYPNFFDIVLYGKYGETMSRYLKKGYEVTVQGRAHQDRWEDNGKKKSRIVFIAEQLELQRAPGADKNESPSPAEEPPVQQMSFAQESANSEPPAEDIPIF